MSVVVEGAAADKVAINHARFVHKNPAANFQIKSAFHHCRHPTAPHTVSIGGNLNTMTDTGYRFAGRKEMASDANKVLVVANVLRCSTARKKYPGILLFTNLSKRCICFDGVAFPLLCDRPARLHFV